MKKIISLIIPILFFTGCTINYDIYVNSDHTVNESISISDSISTLEQSGYKIDDIVTSKIQSYSDEIRENDYSINQQKNDDDITVTLSSKNKAIEKLLKMSYFERMFNGADITDDTDKYTFRTNGLYNQSGLFYDLSGVVDEGFVEKININITFADKVIETNADSFNEETNTYTWSIDANTKDKDINFSLKQSNNKNHKKVSSDDKFNKLLITGSIIVIILISFGYFVIMILNKKRNKI